MAKLHAAQAKCVHVLWLHRVTGLALHCPGLPLRSARVLGQDLVAKLRIPPSVSALTRCLVLSLIAGEEGRVQSIVTIKPEVTFSSHNKVVLKESK